MPEHRRRRGHGRHRRRRHGGRGRWTAAAGTLAAAPLHRRVRVVRVAGGRRLVQRLAAIGIVPGASVTVERNSGPAVVDIGYTRVALDLGVAAAVEVEETG